MADQNYTARTVTVHNPQLDSNVRLPGWMVYAVLFSIAFLVAANMLLIVYVLNVERRLDRELSECRQGIIQILENKKQLR